MRKWANCFGNAANQAKLEPNRDELLTLMLIEKGKGTNFLLENEQHWRVIRYHLSDRREPSEYSKMTLMRTLLLRPTHHA